MTERSRFWDGNTTGDAVDIDTSEFMDRFWRAILNGTGNEGVLNNWLNELEVTDGGGLNASIDTGGAVIYGLFYENDSAATVALPNNATVVVVVRRDWAAQTARLTHDAGAGLVQNPGVTYDIPLATVTTAAGVITLVVDNRDFCEFSTIMLPGAVGTDALIADSVTPAKMEDQTRWVTRGYGELTADATNPATLTADTLQGTRRHGTYFQPYRPYWAFTDGVSDAAWLTFQVPVDLNAATMDVYFWTGRPYLSDGAATQMRWEYNVDAAAASGILGNQVGAATVSYPEARYEFLVEWLWSPWEPGFYHTFNYPWQSVSRDMIGSITVTAGDVVHMQVFRNGAHADDTWTHDGALFMVEIEYTADS